MKSILILLFSTFSVSTAFSNCPTYNSYLNSGWTIHDPSGFKKIEKSIVSIVYKGRQNGDLIFDMSGPIKARHTSDGGPLILLAKSWDDMKTEKDLMFGDYAILRIANDENEIAELRWFDGKNRNIVFNPKFLSCFSENAPFASNSVL